MHTDGNSASQWSVPFARADFDEFLFASGDCEKWLIASRDAVTGAWYSNEPRAIERSSMSSSPSTAKWYRRKSNDEDPWISLTDHETGKHDGDMLYGGESGTLYQNVLRPHNGANVYIRRSNRAAAAAAAGCDCADTPCDRCASRCAAGSHWQPADAVCNEDADGDVFCGCGQYEVQNVCVDCPPGRWVGDSHHRGGIASCIAVLPGPHPQNAEHIPRQ